MTTLAPYPVPFDKPLPQDRFDKKFPRTMRQLDQWCLHDIWKRPVDVMCFSDAKRSFSYPGKPDTWTCYEDAVREAVKYNWGLGFHLSAEDNLCILDLDHVRDPHTGRHLAKWVDVVLDRCQTLTYLSMSQTGYHIVARLTQGLPSGKQVSNIEGETGIDIYDRNHFFAMSGILHRKSPIVDCTEEVWGIYNWASRKLKAKKGYGNKPNTKKRKGKKFTNLKFNNPETSESIVQWLDRHQVNYKPFEANGITMYGLAECPWISGHTTPSKPGEAKVYESSNGPRCFSCWHTHCSSYQWSDFRASLGCPADDPCTRCKQERER